MRLSKLSASQVVRARRWMVSGLVVSIVGTRIVEGGSDGAVASGIFPVFWISILLTFGQILAFSSPLIAKLTIHLDPAKTLVASDFIEGIISAATFALLLLFPQHALPVMAIYFIFASVFPVVTDVVEEFYGSRLASIAEREALSFNTTIYSILAFVGLVMGMPLGSVLAQFSFSALVCVNALLSLGGAILRFRSARIELPDTETLDVSDFKATGTRIKLRHFLQNMLATGVASPANSFLVQLGATPAGIFVYIWIARSAPQSPGVSLAIVIASFGLGATIGPWIAPLLRKHMSMKRALIFAHFFLLVNICGAIFVISQSYNLQWIFMYVYVFLMGISSRLRTVLVTTLRQTAYSGKQFASIMSWSFSMIAAGEIIGAWSATIFDVTNKPLVALAFYMAMIAVSLAFVLKSKTHIASRENQQFANS